MILQKNCTEKSEQVNFYVCIINKLDMEDTSSILLTSSRFWIQRVLIPIFVFIGVTGNTISVMILTRKRMRSSTNVYLSALAIADIIHLLTVFLLSFKHYSDIHDRKYELYWRFMGIIHWLCDAASSTSVWLTVSFTIERYVAVCHPMKRKFFCTENRAKSIITLVYIFCLLTTASTTFEHQLTLEETCIKPCNLTDTLNSDSNNGKSDAKKEYNSFSNNQNKNNHSISTIKYETRSLSNLNDTLFSQFIENNNNLSMDFLKEYKLQLQKELQSTLSKCHSHSHIIYFPYLFPVYRNINNTENLTKDSNNSKSVKTANSKISGKVSASSIEIENDLANDTFCCLKKFTIDTESTSLGSNATYTSFINWYSAIFFGLLPLLLIATFNCFLIRAVYLSQMKRKEMINSQENISLSNENRITLMLIGVIFLFLICQTPTASLLIYSNFANSPDKNEQNIILILGNICNFLMVINSSCNFFLYCVLSQKYRSTFRKIFCERKKQMGQNSIALSTTTRNNSVKCSNITNVNPKPRRVNTFSAELPTPRNLESTSLSTIPRTKSLSSRPMGKARSDDLVV